MANAYDIKKLEDAGIKNANKLPPEVVKVLVTLTPEELKALAAAKSKAVHAEDFGGFIF